MSPKYFHTFTIMAKLNLYYKVRVVEHYGSTVYGTRTERSDIDIIAISESEEDSYTIYQSKDYPELSDYSRDIE